MITAAIAEPLQLSTSDTKAKIREAFERWARWRSGARYYGESTENNGVLGELRDSRGSSVCPTCKGAKRMPGHLIGSTLTYINQPCPTCCGEGKVDGDLGVSRRVRTVGCVFCFDAGPMVRRSTGVMPDGRTCHVCRGAGKRVIVTLQVHPATIKGTRYLGQDCDPDPVSALIERTTEAWSHYNETYWPARVVIEEYTHNGTQEMKAQRLHVSRPWYARNLTEAHRRMAEIIKI
jgi:hypothetical protein